MAFATTDDVGTRLGRDLSDPETLAVTFLLEGATAVIAEGAGRDDDWAAALDPVPKLLKLLAVELTCRALANPNALDGLTEQLGAFNYSARFRNEGGGLLLTKTEELIVGRVVNGSNRASPRTPSILDDIYPEGDLLSEPLDWIQ